MKTGKLVASVVLAVIFGSTAAALADFTGSFSGYYAPANWTIAVSGNPTYDNFAGVLTGGAPDNVTLYGAFGIGTVPSSPSVIDYSIVLQGTGAETVSFSYTFFNPGFALDQAQVLDDGSVVADLTKVNSAIAITGIFQGGDTLDFRVYSVNVNQFDFLEIAPIPEPSTLALLGLGAVACFLPLRRKFARR